MNMKFKIRVTDNMTKYKIQATKTGSIWQNIKYKLPKTGSKMSFIPHFYSLLMKT